MHPKIKTFLDNAKQLASDENLTARKEHLIKLGLTEISEEHRIYIDYSPFEGAPYDQERKKWYEDTHIAIDVTDEEYAEICKYATAVNSKAINTCEEKTLSTIASVILWTGIILSAIGLFAGLAVASIGEEEIGVPLMLSFLILLPSSALSWGLLKVISNISMTLKQINSKLKN